MGETKQGTIRALRKLDKSAKNNMGLNIESWEIKKENIRNIRGAKFTGFSMIGC